MGLWGQVGRFRSRHRRVSLTVFGFLVGALGLVPTAAGRSTPNSAGGGTAGPKAPVLATPPPTRPAVRSGPADQITYQSARLRGLVASGEQTTAYFFLYGPTTSYGSQSLPVSLEPDDHAITVYSPISGLVPLTTYHYKLVAINALGTQFGADLTFTTAAAPLSLAISASVNPDPLGVPLTITGGIVGTGASGSAVVLQRNPFPFTGDFQIVGSPGLASATGSFSFQVPAVSVTTQFRVVSVGPGQPLVSDTLTEFAQIAVTLNVTRGPARSGNPSATFAGLISPAQPGARVSVQRLVGGRWVLVAATQSRAATAAASAYAITLHPTHSGSYRVFAASVEGGHLPSATQPTTIHVHGGVARRR